MEVKGAKPPELESKLSGGPMSVTQPWNTKHRVNGAGSTKNTTGKGQAVPDPHGDVHAQQCGPQHASTALYVSLIRIKWKKKNLRLVMLSFEMFQTRKALIWRGIGCSTSIFVIHSVLLGPHKTILFSQNIFQRCKLMLRLFFFSSRMWQLWRSRVYSVFCWSP